MGTLRRAKHYPDFLPHNTRVANPHDTVREECAKELWAGPLSAEELSRRTVYPPETITLCLFEDRKRFRFMGQRWYLAGANDEVA